MRRVRDDSFQFNCNTDIKFYLIYIWIPCTKLFLQPFISSASDTVDHDIIFHCKELSSSIFGQPSWH